MLRVVNPAEIIGLPDMLSSRSPISVPAGYGFGVVWPLTQSEPTLLLYRNPYKFL